MVSLHATGGMALAAAPSVQAAAACHPPVPEGIDRSYKRRLSGATSLEERLASLDLHPPGHEPSLSETTAGDRLASAPEPQHAAMTEQPAAGRDVLKQSAAAAPDTPAPLHDDPLRRPVDPATPFAAASKSLAPGADDGVRADPGEQSGVQERQGEPPGRAGPAAGALGAGVADVRLLELFTGFVSHEQLDACIGNTSERRAARRQETTHWIKMRGPGDHPRRPLLLIILFQLAILSRLFCKPARKPAQPLFALSCLQRGVLHRVLIPGLHAILHPVILASGLCVVRKEDCC